MHIFFNVYVIISVSGQLLHTSIGKERHLDKKKKGWLVRKNSGSSVCSYEKIWLSSGPGNKEIVNTPPGCSPTAAKNL